MLLYKYVIGDRIDVLKNGLIRFTQPSALNDRWDLKPHVERFVNEDGWERITSPFIKETDDELLDFMAGIIEKGARERNLGDKSRHEIRQALGEAGSEIMTELRKLYEDTLATTLENAKDVVESVIPEVPKIIDRTVGVLSLTQRPDHPAMWAYYANNGTGMVLMFDAGHKFFKPLRDAADDMSRLRRVNYSSERPRFDPLIDLSMLDLDEDSDEWASWIDKFFYTKSTEWGQEKEWRMLRPLKDASNIIESKDGNIHLFELPASCVSGVILGERMNSDMRSQVIELMTRDERYRHASVFETRFSDREFRIEIVPLTNP